MTGSVLFYRDLPVGTLDLKSADPAAVERLLGGAAVRLSALFPGDALRDAARRARKIRDKARENLEERGVDTLFLARAMATWTPPAGTAAVPNAPVLLAGLDLVPRGAAGEDYELSLDADVVVSPTLCYALEANFGVRVAADALGPLEPTPEKPGTLVDPGDLLRRLTGIADAVPGFALTDRLVVGNFSYTKLPMVTDLQTHLDALVDHDLVAAIAGDRDAQATVRSRHVAVDERELDMLELPLEYLVRDADASQQAVIQSVMSESDLVVQGPPGTGKSQTIANLIAALVASGRHVLFVAEKRAAIDAVVGRLDAVGLSDLVLDLHGGVKNKRQLAQDLADALGAAREAPVPVVADLFLQLDARRAALRDHDRAMHEIRTPWGVTLYDAQARTIGRDLGVRLPPSVIDALGAARLLEIKEVLRGYLTLGGEALRTGSSPWLGAGPVDQAAVERLTDAVTELDRGAFDAFRAAAGRVAGVLGVAAPTSGRAAFDAVRLHAELAEFGDRVRDRDLGAFADLSPALEPARRGMIYRLLATLGSPGYRRALRDARALVGDERAEPTELARLAGLGASLIERWREIGGAVAAAFPSPDPDAGCAAATFERLIDELAPVVPALSPDAPLDDVSATVRALAGDLATLRKLPALQGALAAFEEAGLTPFVIMATSAGLGPDDAVAALDATWAGAVVERIVARDPAVGAFSGHVLTADATRYVVLDRDHIRRAVGRVKRSWAERLVAARDRYEEQNLVLSAQAKRKSGHLPVRELFALAPDVLTAVKPCWAMSPLLVSQILPADRPYFDVVVFDEASQIPPADAIPSILRARRAVVAGDDLQLPPTTFFASQTTVDREAEEEELDGEGEVLTSGFDSILDVAEPLVGGRPLRWHYRSRDERLIAFSNLQIYRPKHRELTTFPSVTTEAPIRHVRVTRSGSATTGTSGEEVDAVVRLVLEHAQERPGESLGVIAMGIKHAERVAEAVRQARLGRDDLEAFFAEKADEPFFVKNLERVQGDERDAIIITIGYGPGPDGRLRHQFGPINQQGGERRLNVAITRAKRRLTLVSSFGSEDVDLARSSAEGVRLLRGYLRYAETGGTDLGGVVPPRPELNAFERDVALALEAEGLDAVAQLGTSGYYLDFAVRHPERPGRFVLAIECDGAIYHSAPTTRERDRLRQQQLETIGWRFHRIWSPDWFHDRPGEIERIKAAYREALDADAAPPVVHTDPPGAMATDAEQDALETRPVRRLPMPRLHHYDSVTEVPGSVIDSFVEWVESDDLLRTEDEVVAEVLVVLGFARRGKNIVAAIERSIERVHARRNHPDSLRPWTPPPEPKQPPATPGSTPARGGRRGAPGRAMGHPAAPTAGRRVDERDLDPLIHQAITVVQEYQRASASLLRRRLKIGDARAAQIIDQLEALGYLGPSDGSNARQVLRHKE